MTLKSFTCTDFRCLTSAKLTPEAGYNLVYGPNASGKTSLLEAIAYLGRGKSFRGATTDRLIRHGSSEFVLFGKVAMGQREVGLGVRNGRTGLEISIDGDRQPGAAALAEVLPLQIVDPEVHNLVAGGPEYRRRFLDWVAFHVEQGYLDVWRRFRRVLKQRNAALREGAVAGLDAWDREFAALGQELHVARERVLENAISVLEATGKRLLGEAVGFDYRQGWPANETLPAALAGSRAKDLTLRSTQSGPHRADLRLVYDERQARKLVSRGQQKLLACTMILAATGLVQSHLGRGVLLLLDDPAAELDSASLGRLMGEVVQLDCQVIATALHAEADLFPRRPARFHVEHGVLKGE